MCRQDSGLHPRRAPRRRVRQAPGIRYELVSVLLSLPAGVACSAEPKRATETTPPPPAGSHTKYIADALKSDKNVKFSEDGETILEGSELTE